MSSTISATIVLCLLGLYYSWEIITGVVLARVVHPQNKRPVWQTLFVLVGLCVLPTIALALSLLAFRSDWKGATGLGWFGVLNETGAGAAILPLWAAGIVSIAVGLFRKRWLYESWLNFFLVAGLAVICAWHTAFAPISLKSLGLGGSNFLEMLIFLPFPALACINYMVLLRSIWRNHRLTGKWRLWLGVWIGGMLATATAKILLAIRIYNKLPDTPPCFIVSAAATGHHWIVGSWPDRATGHIVNMQLRRFRELEALLRERYPAAHCFLRRIYNRIGPFIAAHINTPIRADLIYFLLKPLELLAMAVTRKNR